MLKQIAWTGILLAGLASPALAGGVYRWTAADGSVSFADDLERVPARFRASARKIELGDLADYPRYTPQLEPARAARADRLFRRLEALRAANQPAARQLAPAPGTSETQTIVRMDHGTALQIPNPGSAAGPEAEPLVVENIRVRERGGVSTRHVTVLRQGGRIVSVVEGEGTHSSFGWPRLEELVSD